MLALNNGQDDEAVALQQFYFADEPAVAFRHYPQAKYSFLIWQAGVNEPDEIADGTGKTIEVERFHLMFFAPTKDRLIELLDGVNA